MYLNTKLHADVGVKLLEIIHENSMISNYYQFLLLQKGSVVVTVNDADSHLIMHENDVILFKPNTKITCAPVPELSNILCGIRIDPGFIESIAPDTSGLECNSVSNPSQDYTQIKHILFNMCSSYYNQPNIFEMHALIYNLADCLSKNFIHIQKNIPLNEKRIYDIRNYLNQHYDQPILLSDLAEALYLTPQYVSKFIKDHMHTTFSKYLLDIRLDHATRELQNSNVSITTIALNNGFPNIAALNKAFKEKHGQTPAAYRQSSQKHQAHQIHSNNPEISPLKTDHHTTIFTKAVSAKPISRVWQDTINMGPLVQALNIDFHDSLLEYQKYLHFKYIRFINIFDKEILYKDPESGNFCFTNLDVILDFFREADILPFIELSYKPPKNLHMHPAQWDDDVFFENEHDTDYCLEALNALIKHCINRYGYAYVSQWRFEIWLRHNKRLIYNQSSETYANKYLAFYHVIKAILPMCPVGGFGFNISSNIEAFQDYIQYFEQQSIPFDFFSFSAYMYKNLNAYALDDLSSAAAILSPDPSYIRSTLNEYQRILSGTIYSNTPIMITEMASLITPYNHITSSMYQAAFICKNMTQLMDMTACVAYHGFYGTSSANSNTPDNFYPISGLIRSGGLPNPSYHACAMLAHLGKQLIAYGNNYIMTQNSSNQYQILFFNYVHFKESFCFHPVGNIDLKDTYAVFENTENLEIDFTCESFNPGRYKIMKVELSRKYGSLLDTYLQILHAGSTTSEELLNTVMNLTEEESRYYKQTSLPRQDIYYTSIGDTLKLHLSLEPHTLLFYEFTRTI